MLRLCWIALALVFTSHYASAADTRWCTIKGAEREKKDELVYLPIAKAAHVEGVVILRVTFDPSGTVKSIESISGHPLLVEPSTSRIKNWRFDTDATGNELCQNLVIIKYRILPENYTAPEPGSEPKESQPAGSYLIRIDAYTLVII